MWGTGHGRPRARHLLIAAAICIATMLVPALAIGANPSFPGTPGESPRINTPDDPDFDECEGDDEDGVQECQTYFEEQFRAFGFSPDSANLVPGVPHSIGATPYLDCSQLDAQGRAANVAARDLPCSQIAGIRADSAWKYSTGDPDVTIAILDTGIRWQDTELRDKIRLNAAELPQPQTTGGAPCGADDCNGDGAFSVSDFADDPRVSKDAGDDTSDTGSNADNILDASDLIATFSGDGDNDGNARR